MIFDEFTNTTFLPHISVNMSDFAGLTARDIHTASDLGFNNTKSKDIKHVPRKYLKQSCFKDCDS